uniref:Cytochrome P450 n=1 Tax=Fagus sylvatica TaxID=28930 RepID=A0A2N9HK21_FAGSY
METWLIIVITLCISALLNLLINPKVSKNNKLPPGPFTIPILGNFLLLLRKSSEVEPILRKHHAKYGPIITLRISFRPFIFIANHTLAHKSLVQNGAIFADRPPALLIDKLISRNQHNINTAFYGPTWRLLRRNLISEILHPSRVKSYSRARKWVLDILLNRLLSQSESGDPVIVKDHLQYSMFCLLVLMCFGDKLGETQIKEIEDVHRRLLLRSNRFNILNIWRSLGKIIFRKRWQEFYDLMRDQEAVLMPLIEARRKVKQERLSKAKEDKDDDDEFVVSYVDTLLDLELPEEKRKLQEGEMVTLCSEFLNGGTDTTSTTLAVDHGEFENEVKEEDLNKMPYLKAVVLEGLRRHPPAHFVLPHAVTEDVVLDGYLVPKNAALNFMVAEMGWDPKVWEDPMAFKPERFLSGGGDGGGEVFDITGSREIQDDAVWAVDGDEVDLSEKQEFTIAMKYPLKAHLSRRI